MQSQVKYNNGHVGSYMLIFVIAALICYEYLITLDDEIRTVWRRKFSAVSLLIVSTRWSLLLYAVTLVTSSTKAFGSHH